MSDTRSTTDYQRRHRRHRHRSDGGSSRPRRHRDPDPDTDSVSDSGYSSPASEVASRATGASGRNKRTAGNALVVREKYIVQQLPRNYPASEYSDDYEEYTVGGGRGQRWGRDREKVRERERGIFLVIAAFVVGLIFCLRETRRR